jgi:hypothetical protein
MDQKSMIVFIYLKELSVKDVHTELIQALESGAIAYSTVAKDMHNDVILQNEPETEDRAEEQGFSITDTGILAALEMMLVSSIHQIAKMTFIPPTTVFRRLTKSLRFVLKRLCSVPTDSRIFRNKLGSSCQRSY